MHIWALHELLAIPHIPSQMKKLSLLPLLFVVSTAALSAQTTYLHLDGITIPGQPAGHLDELRITSFESGATSPTVVMSGSVSAGKPSFANLRLASSSSAMNSALYQRMVTGLHITGGELRTYDINNQVTSKIELGDVIVVGLKTAGADADVSHTIDLAFGRIRWWGIPPGSTLKVLYGWNLAQNIVW